SRSRHPASSGATDTAAASRSLTPSLDRGPPRASHRRYTAALETPEGGVGRGEGRPATGAKGNGGVGAPHPGTRAPAPTRQKGTSAPRAAAMARSEQPAHRSTAAASADPPPRPPPAGIRLTRRTDACFPTASRARRTRLSGPADTIRPPWPG